MASGDNNVDLELLNEDKDLPITELVPKAMSNMTNEMMRGPLGPINRFIDIVEDSCTHFYNANKTLLDKLFLITLIVGYFAYVAIACILDYKRARTLFNITIVVVLCVFYSICKKYFGSYVNQQIIDPIKTNVIDKFWKWIKWSFIFLFVAFIVIWIIYDSYPNPERMISLAGLFVYVTIGFLFSTNRRRIKWRPVLVGFAMQYICGLIILRTKFGFLAFNWIGQKITILLGFSSEGSTFLFKDLTQFAFTILPVVAYFSALVQLLWYFGILQVMIKKISWVLEITLGTSPAESFNAAGNIFVGMVTAPLLIKPFLQGMTESELHAVMTGGFATIAGSVLGIFTFFGISATHLISASIMSAPAALAMSKLMCPEVEEPPVKRVRDLRFDKPRERNFFEAITAGASQSIGLLAGIVVNVIAFLSLLKFANSVLGWLGSMVGEPAFSFEYICSYLLMPFAFIMGIPWKDSFVIAELLGIKIFLNEFIAYQKLSVFIKNRENGVGETLSIRSEVIATYALCGFANFGSMGIMLGGISSLIPNKRGVLSKHLLRSFVAGMIACFMTACIAGLLYDESESSLPNLNSTNSTLLRNATRLGQ